MIFTLVKSYCCLNSLAPTTRIALHKNLSNVCATNNAEGYIHTPVQLTGFLQHYTGWYLPNPQRNEH